MSWHCWCLFLTSVLGWYWRSLPLLPTRSHRKKITSGPMALLAIRLSRTNSLHANFESTFSPNGMSRLHESTLLLVFCATERIFGTGLCSASISFSSFLLFPSPFPNFTFSSALIWSKCCQELQPNTYRGEFTHFLESWFSWMNELSCTVLEEMIRKRRRACAVAL